MKKKIPFKGVKFLLFMVGVYIFLAIFDLDGFHKSLIKIGDILSQTWPIFVFIILITALINYFLKPEHIIKHFGENSGKKGIFFALLAGIISHGPMYAWYGLVQDLREKGLKDHLLMIFFYARAVKIPMIPFSIAIFGTPFTIIITLYILLFAILQGKIYTYFEK